MLNKMIIVKCLRKKYPLLLRPLLALILAATMALLTIYTCSGTLADPRTRLASLLSHLDVTKDQNRILPAPSRTFVINLPRRQDRYADMERLRARLGVNWVYAAAEDSGSTMVSRIMAQTWSVRGMAMRKMNDDTTDTNATITAEIQLPFSWPPHPWPDSIASGFDFNFFEKQDLLPASNSDSRHEPLTCAKQDFTITPYTPGDPEHRILTRSRVACWHSHVSTIRKAVALQRCSRKSQSEATLILEDDVDMEINIKARLGEVWDVLPADWDVVFLGHCWSNESYHPALEPRLRMRSTKATSITNTSLQTHVHPSHRPLCTHAYALSPAGAHRILAYLTYPPFAYSRAIDRALAWLIESGRIRSFSVVPPVVVQRKIRKSDVVAGADGMGSAWRESLINGVLANVVAEEEPGVGRDAWYDFCPYTRQWVLHSF